MTIVSLRRCQNDNLMTFDTYTDREQCFTDGTCDTDNYS